MQLRGESIEASIKIQGIEGEFDIFDLLTEDEYQAFNKNLLCLPNSILCKFLIKENSIITFSGINEVLLISYANLNSILYDKTKKLRPQLKEIDVEVSDYELNYYIKALKNIEEYIDILYN